MTKCHRSVSGTDFLCLRNSDVISILLSSSRKILRYYLKIGHCRLFIHPFQFVSSRNPISIGCLAPLDEQALPTSQVTCGESMGMSQFAICVWPGRQVSWEKHFFVI